MKTINLLIAVSLVFLLSPLTFYAQSDPHHDKRLELEPLETPDDPYLPNAFFNKKVSPPYKFKTTARSATPASTITTVQVNVNSSGQNIVADAANEPGITINPLDGNQMAIGWRQFDNVLSNFRQAGWAYTTDAGLTWTFPGAIDAGIFHSDPVLDYDLAGNFYYNGLHVDNNGIYTCEVYKSFTGGDVWTSGVPAAGGDKQWMAIDRTQGQGSGNIYSYWTSSFSSCAPANFTRSSTGGTSFESCTISDIDLRFGTMMVGYNGELYIGGLNAASTDSFIVIKSNDAQFPGSSITWLPSVKVFMDTYFNFPAVNPAGLPGQVNIDVDQSNGPGHDNVYILASMGRLSTGDPGDVLFSKSTDGGLTWTPAMQINDDVSGTNSQWMATMSVAPNGRIDVAWLDTRDITPVVDASALYYSYSTDQGTTWSANEKLSISFDPHIGYPNQDKMGDYFDMISDNTGAHLAWAATFNNEEDIYYSRIIPGIVNNSNEIINEQSFSVFPNPTTGVFTIRGELKNATVEIYNLQGQNIYSQKLEKNSSEINLSAQSPGIYMLKVIHADGISSVKKLMRK